MAADLCVRDICKKVLKELCLDSGVPSAPLSLGDVEVVGTPEQIELLPKMQGFPVISKGYQGSVSIIAQCTIFVKYVYVDNL